MAQMLLHFQAGGSAIFRWQKGVNAKFLEQLGKLSEAMVEMPFAAARSMIAPNGQGGQQELQQAGWKAYDAWVRLMSESANSLYDSPEVGASVGRSMEASLKWQRMGSAIGGAFFAALWPAVGMRTATELAVERAAAWELPGDQ